MGALWHSDASRTALPASEPATLVTPNTPPPRPRRHRLRIWSGLLVIFLLLGLAIQRELESAYWQAHFLSRYAEKLSYTLQPPMPVSSQGDSASDAGAAPAASPAAPGDATQAVFHDLDVALTNIHEQELLAFLEDYRGHVKGRFRVNACALSARTEAGLTARCTLRFFTLPDDVPAAAAQ